MSSQSTSTSGPSGKAGPTSGRITAQVAAFASRIRYQDLPPDVVKATKRVLLDSIGCAVAAAVTPKGNAVLETVPELGPGDLVVWGSAARAGTLAAVFANAELVNALDLDEVLLNWGHIAPFVFPPAVAVTEIKRLGGRALLSSLAVGYEVAARVGGALSAVVLLRGAPGDLETATPHAYGYGFASFGAAAAVANLLRLDPRATASALGIAGHGSPVPGTVKWSHTPPVSMHKYCPPGAAALAGLTAALLASHAYTGDAEILDGEYGYPAMVGSEFWDPNLVITGLGERWTIPDTSIKLYPCCRYLHGSMDLIDKLIRQSKVDPDAIDEINVALFSRAAGASVFGIRDLRDHMDIQFSIPFSIAAAALGVHRGPQMQEKEILRDPRLKRLAEKVSIEVDPRVAEARYAVHGLRPVQAMRELPCRVEIVCGDRRYSDSATYAIGDPWDETTQVSDDVLYGKFRQCVEPVLGTQRCARIIDKVDSLERSDDVSSLTAELARPAGFDR